MGTIAEKLTYLDGTKQALKTSINNIGGDITSETTFREYAQELDNIYDNLPKTTGEDTNLSLTTLKGKMNIQVKGDTNQDGTPTPDTPIDIEVVTGTQEVKVENVNICTNADILNTQNLRFYVDKGGLQKISTLSFITDISLSNNSVYLFIGTTNKGSIGTITGNANTRVSTTITLTDTLYNEIQNSSEDIQFRVYKSGANWTKVEQAQIENSSVATPFTPHQEQTQTISLGDIELCRVPNTNYQDYIYKSNDKWYKKEQIGKFYGGEQTWSVHDISISGVASKLFRSTALNIEKNKPSLSNYYTCLNQAIRVSPCFYINVDNPYIDVVDNNHYGVSEFTTYCSTNGIVFYVPLATPNDIEITNETLIEQLDNLEKLKSYNGTTNISSSGNLPMVLNVSALKGSD